MQLTCPSCAATYDVPDDAIGTAGRKIRCRACDTSWFEPGRASSPAPIAPAAAPPTAAAPVPPIVEPAPSPVAVSTPATRRRLSFRLPVRVPWLLLGLGAAVVGLGAVASMLAYGPEQVAARLGLSDQRSPLGISITRPPDWRLIAGGSQLFAVSGRIWNPTSAEQPVPDLHAELKDRQGRTVYSWTIARPVGRLAPGAAASFDGAAVDVPASSANVSVTFADPRGG